LDAKDPSSEFIAKDSTVEVFGEFSQPRPWMMKVPCSYDHMFKCFKADILIQKG
jgi:hypothetical protein